MNKFTVTWSKRSQGLLAQIWIDNPQEREAITRAAFQVDIELAENPEQKGREEAEGLRSLRVTPLTVLFEVREPDCLVEVVSVKRIRQKTNGSIGALGNQ
jgi:hypothetical protein